MNEMKSIIQNLATIAKRELPKCKVCQGGGKLYNGKGMIPCPYCADLLSVAEMKWHEKHHGLLFKGNANKDSKVICQSQIIGSIGACACGKTWLEYYYNTEGKYSSDKGTSNYCSAYKSEAPSIPELRSMLEIVGVWEKLVRYCGMSVKITNTRKVKCPVNGEIDLTTFDYAGMQVRFANILTSDQFYTVVSEFLTKEVEGK